MSVALSRSWQINPLRRSTVYVTNAPPLRLGRNGSPAEPSACCEFLDQRLHGGKVVGNGLGAFLTVKEVSKVCR
jgi:hypothetical protein